MIEVYSLLIKIVNKWIILIYGKEIYKCIHKYNYVSQENM